MAESNKVIFYTEDDEKVEFTVIEQTKVNGCNYLLVTDEALGDEEAEAYILKDISAEESEEAIYDMVEDENELEAIGKVFSELIEDIELR